jgi:hypothetical protein
MNDNLLPPVVIVGSERSGTNLLRALLSTHSQIASPPPAGIVDALGGIQARYFPNGRPADLAELIDDVVALTKTHLNPWDMDLDSRAIKARVKHASLWEVFRVVNEIYAEEHGRPCWCSKEPGLFNYISEIAVGIPDAKFVYLARDGRDVAASVLRGHLHEFHVYFAAQSWAGVQRLCLNALADPVCSGRMYLLKYEDLIEDPEQTMRDLMRFVNLEFESQQLRYYQDEKVLDHSRKSRFWKNLAYPINRTNTGMYKETLGITNTKIFESVACVELAALKYPVDSSHRRSFTPFDIRMYRAIAFLRRKLWNMDPRAEALRTRARVRATRRIMNRDSRHGVRAAARK